MNALKSMDKRMCRVYLAPLPVKSKRQTRRRDSELALVLPVWIRSPGSCQPSQIGTDAACRTPRACTASPRLFLGACGSWLLAASVLLILQKSHWRGLASQGHPGPSSASSETPTASGPGWSPSPTRPGSFQINGVHGTVTKKPEGQTDG